MCTHKKNRPTPEQVWEGCKQYCANESYTFKRLTTYEQRSEFLFDIYQIVMSQIYGQDWLAQVEEEYTVYWNTFMLRDAGEDIMEKYGDQDS